MTATTGEPIDSRAMRSVGLPMMMGSLVAAAVGLFDVAVVGRSGMTAMAGVAGGVVVFEIASNIVLAASVGVRVLLPRALGARDPMAVALLIRTSSSMQIMLGLALAAVLVAFAHPLAAAVVGVEDRVATTAATFIRVTAVTVVLQAIGAVATAYLAAARRTDLVLRFGLLAVTANLVLDIPFVFGIGDWPGFGATGAAVATVVGYVLSVGAGWSAVRRLVSADRTTGGTSAPIRASGLLAISWPAITSAVLDYVGAAVFFGVIGRFGGADLAGGRLAYQLALFAFVMLGGLGAAATVLLGRNHGARGSPDLDGERFVLRYFGAAGFVAALALAVVGGPVAAVVGINGDALHTFWWATVVVALSAVPMARSVGSAAVLRYRGATGRDLVSNIVSVWAVQIPVAVLAALLVGPAAAFLGFFGYWVCRALVNEFLLRRMGAIRS